MLCVYHPKVSEPPRPKLRPGMLFLSKTGKYLVMDHQSGKSHWKGSGDNKTCDQGYVCVRLDNFAGPRHSSFDTWEWENRGSYTVIPNGQYFELQQHLPV